MGITEITGSYRTKLIVGTYRPWIRKGDKVLDIGCGTGIVTNILKKVLSIKITGADVKNYLIYKNIPFIKISNGLLPIKKGAYDVSLLNDVLHHLEKSEQANLIQEAMRAAEKVLIFEFEPSLLGKLCDIILNKFHYGDLNTPLSMRSKEEWQILFKNLGFKSKVVKVNKPFWYPFSHIAFMVTKK